MNRPGWFRVGGQLASKTSDSPASSGASNATFARRPLFASPSSGYSSSGSETSQLQGQRRVEVSTGDEKSWWTTGRILLVTFGILVLLAAIGLTLYFVLRNDDDDPTTTTTTTAAATTTTSTTSAATTTSTTTSAATTSTTTIAGTTTSTTVNGGGYMEPVPECIFAECMVPFRLEWRNSGLFPGNPPVYLSWTSSRALVSSPLAHPTLRSAVWTTVQDSGTVLEFQLGSSDIFSGFAEFVKAVNQDTELTELSRYLGFARPEWTLGLIGTLEFAAIWAGDDLVSQGMVAFDIPSTIDQLPNTRGLAWGVSPLGNFGNGGSMFLRATTLGAFVFNPPNKVFSVWSNTEPPGTMALIPV